MSKTLNKYFRKIHRWMVLPFIVIMLTVMLGQGTAVAPVAQRLQQLMILAMVITGVYLFLLPYWTKWQRQRRRTKGAQK